MDDDRLWNLFNLGEHNLDKGAGILYWMRYEKEDLKKHQENVIGALKSIGMDLQGLDDKIVAYIGRRIDKSEGRRVCALLEELSCLNEALEYAEYQSTRYSSVSELAIGIKANYYGMIRNNQLADASTLLYCIPKMVSDLKIADSQNGVLSDAERQTLDDLMAFSKKNYRTIYQRKSPGLLH